LTTNTILRIPTRSGYFPRPGPVWQCP
jgi:hypothetical protein